MEPAPGKAAARQQLNSLTGMRGIAAWLVVFYHVRDEVSLWMPAWFAAIYVKGYLAVDLFFALSGFVIWLNYADWFRRQGWAGYPGFLRKRLARIWPLHAAMLLVMIALAAALAVRGGTQFVDHPWSELPLHFALIQNWGLTADTRWNVPAWSISTEFAAYLVFPIFVIVTQPERWRQWVIIGAIVGLSFALSLIMASAGATALNYDIPRFGLVRCLSEFTIGALVAVLWRRTLNVPHTTMLAAGLIAAVMTGLWSLGYISEILAIPLIIGPLILTVAHGDKGRFNILSSKPIVWLGEISYSTYLLHFVGWAVFKQTLMHGSAHASPLQLATFLLCVLFASALSYRLIEQTARRAWSGAKI